MSRYALLCLAARLLLSGTANQLPAHFEPYDSGFLARTNRGAYFLAGSGTLRFSRSQLEMKFSGASKSARAVPFDALAGKSNYLRGRDPKQWRTSVPQYGGVRFRQLYPGIDLVYHASSGADLEYDLVVSAHVSTRQIAMQFSGADSVHVDQDGGLIVNADGHDLHLERPRISQDGRPVPGGYRLVGTNTAAFWIGEYDRNRSLLIDPVVGAFVTFGDSGTNILGIATDASGNIYVAGNTYSIPLTNAIQPNLGSGNCAAEANRTSPCQDIFIAKLDPTGTTLAYSTYLGDNGVDWFGGLAVDAQGNAYVAASGYPAGFYSHQPLTGGHGFVRKLSPNGSALLYDESLGANTQAAAIALDASGNAYVTGASTSASFPAVHAIQPKTIIKPMFVTKDGGVTWSPISIPAMQVNMLAIPPGQSSTMYAATPVGLFKSLDTGVSWTNLIPTSGAVTAVVLDPKTPSTVYAVYGTASSTNGSVILARSNDAGSTWIPISSGIPLDPIFNTPPPIVAVAIDPQNSSTIWIATAGLDARVDKSLDGGKTWQIVFGAMPVPPPFPFSPSGIVIDPTNSSHVYACCGNVPGSGVYFTQDAGATWTKGSPSSSVHAPVLDPANPSVLYAASYSGLERSPDGGQTWTAVNIPPTPQNINNVLIDPSGVMYVISDGGYLLRSPDKGATWTTTQGPWGINSTLLAIDPVHSGTVYVSSPQTQIQDAIAVKLDSAGNTLWATLLGGSSNDAGQAIAVDAKGNAYITGITSSSDFPTMNPFQGTIGNGVGNQTDAFVAEISADGSTLIYSTYLGGRYSDNAIAIGVDPSGTAYVGGSTNSPDFPLVNPPPFSGTATFGFGSFGGFLTKIAPGGRTLTYSAPLPSSPSVVAIDSNGSPWIAGNGGLGMSLVQPLQESAGGGFINQLTPSGSALQFSTFFGGFGCGAIGSLAFGAGGSAWVVGPTCPGDFSSIPATQSEPGSSLIARIDPAPPAAQAGVPRIDSVYNGASFQLGNVISPGEVVTLIGAELASSTQTAAAPLPATLADTSVAIGGVPTPLYFVSPSQINFQAPIGLPLGITNVTVTRAGKVTYGAVNVINVRPGIFFVNGIPAVTHASDFSLVTAANPAHPGEYLAVFCSGLGPTSPTVPAGTAPVGLAPLQTQAFAVVGSREVNVQYAGLVPGNIGLYQVNFQLPPDTTPELTDLYILGSQFNTNDVLLYVK